jgi:hypothetical protein
MYREGKRMTHVDSFLRNPVDSDRTTTNKIKEKEIYVADISEDCYYRNNDATPQSLKSPTNCKYPLP